MYLVFWTIKILLQNTFVMSRYFEMQKLDKFANG